MDGFDTLAAAEALENAGMEPKQAKACAAQMRAAVGAGRAELATKADIAAVKADIAAVRGEIVGVRGEIVGVKAEILKWMFGVAAGQIALVVALIKLLP